MNKLFDAVLFDMNGVVIDNTPAHQMAWRDLALTHGQHFAHEELEDTNGRRAIDVVVQKFGVEAESHTAITLSEEYEAMHRAFLLADRPQLIPGIREFLEGLKRKGVPRVLATSASLGSAQLALGRAGLLSLFDQLVTAHDVTRGKPDPEIYIKAARKCDADIRHCLVVEDAVAGVRAAKTAGASCLAICKDQHDDNLLRAGADWTTDDFFNLPTQVLAGLCSK